MKPREHDDLRLLLAFHLLFIIPALLIALGVLADARLADRFSFASVFAGIGSGMSGVTFTLGAHFAYPKDSEDAENSKWFSVLTTMFSAISLLGSIALGFVLKAPMP